MIEKNIVTLSNGGRYLLIHDLGEFEGEEGKRYFFAMGVTPANELDAEDVLFFEVYDKNGVETLKKVPTDTEMFKVLTYSELMYNAIENIPGYRKKLQEELENEEDSDE